YPRERRLCDRPPWTPTLAAATIGSYALVRQPQAGGGLPRLPEDVDGNAAPRIPITANPQPLRLYLVEQALANADGDVLVETAMIAEGAEEQLQALGFDDGLGGRVV